MSRVEDLQVGGGKSLRVDGFVCNDISDNLAPSEVGPMGSVNRLLERNTHLSLRGKYQHLIIAISLNV